MCEFLKRAFVVARTDEVVKEVLLTSICESRCMHG